MTVRRQLFRFGVVGLNAAWVNMVVLAALVEGLDLEPAWANILAFLVAYQVSFFGHRYWTFKEIEPTRFAWGKFFIVAGLSFLLNEGLFVVFLHGLHLYYPFALLLTLVVVPPLTFVASKLWAFSGAQS